MSDVEQILSHYAARAANPRLVDRYTATSAGDVYGATRRERAVTRALQDTNMFPLAGKSILDIGCGDGALLRRFVDMGADPDECYGVDVNPGRLATARSRNCLIHFVESNAESISIDRSFDLVVQFTAFSSMPSERMRRGCAAEMLRLLKPDGRILWYDFRVRDPRNARVTPMNAGAVHALFPRCRIDFRSVTLAPPISRLLAPHSEISCLLLEKIPALRTHLRALISREKGPA